MALSSYSNVYRLFGEKISISTLIAATTYIYNVGRALLEKALALPSSSNSKAGSSSNKINPNGVFTSLRILNYS